MTAGFHAASGDAVVPMDVDLQDPPELLSDFLRKWEEGYDVVLGLRRQRESDTMFKRITAGLFYKIFNILCGKRLVPNAGDYRLMNRAALDALNSLPERVRFTKGLYAWVGFKQATVEYDRPQRVAGSTKWNAWKLWNFALDGITSFSTLPLRIWSYLGMVCGAVWLRLCGCPDSEGSVLWRGCPRLYVHHGRRTRAWRDHSSFPRRHRGVPRAHL